MKRILFLSLISVVFAAGCGIRGNVIPDMEKKLGD
jgi:hypothetical protein